MSDPLGANGRFYRLASAARGSGKVLGKRAVQRRGYTTGAAGTAALPGSRSTDAALNR